MSAGIAAALAFATGTALTWCFVGPLARMLCARAAMRASGVHERERRDLQRMLCARAAMRASGASLPQSPPLSPVRQGAEALCVGGAFACAMGGGQSILCGSALAFCAFAMAVAVECDVSSSVIPRETCYPIALLGGAVQIVDGGLLALAAGAAFALALCAACAGLGVLLARGRASPAVGGGDVRCMFALALASGWEAPWGFFACYAAAAVWSIIRRVRKGCGWDSTFPMAPFLSLWLAAAVLL